MSFFRGVERKYGTQVWVVPLKKLRTKVWNGGMTRYESCGVRGHVPYKLTRAQVIYTFDLFDL